MKGLAQMMRKWADRLDPDGAPRATQFRFRFVEGVGVVVSDTGPGCMLWYLGQDDLEEAWVQP